MAQARPARRRAAPRRAAPPRGAAQPPSSGKRGGSRTWLFDLDNTLHNASLASFPGIEAGMTAYVERELALTSDAAHALRELYLRRYGTTLLGLVRHHRVLPAHFLHETHVLPELEALAHGHPPDFAALGRLPGRKVVLTNAPRAYALRVLRAIGAERHFDAVFSIEDMAMFGQLRPKPDARMLRAVAARLKTHPSRCVLIEDTLQHLKAACSIGMATAWMQRWMRRARRKHAGHPPKVGVYLHRRPAYVCARIFSLGELRRLL